jgi:hypothetical protein
MHGHDPDHIGVGLTAFREVDHDVGKSVTLDLIVPQSKFETRHSECGMQVDKPFAIESFWKHAVPLRMRLLQPSDI